MRVEENVVTVPAKIYTETVYIADDDTKFNDEKACLIYEKKLKEKMEKEKHPVYRSAISGVESFYDEHAATLFYLRNVEDHDYLEKTQCGENRPFTSSDFDKFGEGWYMLTCYDYECSKSSVYLENYNNYVESLRLEVNNYIKNIHLKFMEKMNGEKTNDEKMNCKGD